MNKIAGSNFLFQFQLELPVKNAKHNHSQQRFINDQYLEIFLSFRRVEQ